MSPVTPASDCRHTGTPFRHRNLEPGAFARLAILGNGDPSELPIFFLVFGDQRLVFNDEYLFGVIILFPCAEEMTGTGAECLYPRPTPRSIPEHKDAVYRICIENDRGALEHKRDL